MDKVARYLASYPDKEESEKYDVANKIFIFIYAFMVIGSVLSLPSMFEEISPAGLLLAMSFVLLIPGVIVFLLYKKSAIGYLVLGFFLIRGLFQSFAEYEAGDTVVMLELGVGAFMLAYVAFLKIKLFPYQNLFNMRKGEDGRVIFTKAQAMIENKESQLPG